MWKPIVSGKGGRVSKRQWILSGVNAMKKKDSGRTWNARGLNMLRLKTKTRLWLKNMQEVEFPTQMSEILASDSQKGRVAGAAGSPVFDTRK